MLVPLHHQAITPQMAKGAKKLLIELSDQPMGFQPFEIESQTFIATG